ncbi:tripartite tricarboxylate transporter substrate binding protein [Bordetella hinzii]|uniref:Tripartite tricarboxylate transporter family receptor n=1 Tax=Bordetella hinzii OH87 BAL007II TaxID=1331262 RepID=A0ABR4R4Z3_9BORD|nr:tripartite tricarboxylate transporter substrate binding protein [Bordetella hinzii]KCB25232.1 tripartite tricarboxylate transporter family receptor [Bordetella hinzii OH87 BAL007II]KCB40152.1 tripartite tricarboxylate transporter family receptor [Bordetella hinzii 5132]QDJ32293.1 tripartite tricarboxylate transporter substrate binding protein [Bordetella hinzii]QDJ41420.1 tripartite tricarboxylate transporter substrate binding protein [Bordetella hinzii]
MKAKTCLAAGLLGAIAMAGAAQAQDWPGAKPVTVVVPYTAGGSADAIGRRLGEVLRKETGATVIIENKPGAGAGLGTDQVARAQPDGATLLLASTSPLTILPHLRKTHYDPMKDLAPVASVAVAPVAIVATKALRVDDFAGLIDFARRHPDAVRFGTPGQGTVAHVGMAALMGATQVRMTHVPYRGNSQALTDGLGGTVELLVVNSDVVLPHVASGALKPLAVMAPERLAVWPQVPTLAELKLPQAQYYSNFGIFAPAGMSAGLMHSLQAALQRAMANPDYQDLLAKSYLQPGTGVGETFAKQVRQEYASNAQIIKANDIKAE